jgi:hypothetical protein
MVVADPEQALIEAIAAEACEPDVNFMFCTTHQTDSGQWPCPVGPRAAYAALVEHLGMVEETYIEPAGFEGVTNIPTPTSTHRRLVSRWVEVDHGSE